MTAAPQESLPQLRLTLSHEAASVPMRRLRAFAAASTVVWLA
jgi:hypothetical protein